MRAGLGILFLFVAAVVAIFGGFGFLIMGIYELASNFDSLTIGDFMWAAVLMLGRDVLAFFIAFIFGVFGYALINK